MKDHSSVSPPKGTPSCYIEASRNKVTTKHPITVTSDATRIRTEGTPSSFLNDADSNFGTSRDTGSEFNAEPPSNSSATGPKKLCKIPVCANSGYAPECGHSTDPLKKDPMRLWKEMGGEKSKFNRINRKRVVARREQQGLAEREEENRFMKPGIINYVSNQKQVLSIIKAFIKSDDRENVLIQSKQAKEMRTRTRELSDGKKECHNLFDSGTKRENELHNTSALPREALTNQTRVSPLSVKGTPSYCIEASRNKVAIKHPINVTSDATHIRTEGKPSSFLNDADSNFGTSRDTGFEFNAEPLSNSSATGPKNLCKIHVCANSGYASKCGCSTDPLEKDPVRLWKEMGGEKSKFNTINRKRELARRKQQGLAEREEENRFMKPGIINHVRNRKQVLSIIKAFIKSDDRENVLMQSKQAKEMRTRTRELSDGKKECHNLFDSGTKRENELHNTSALPREESTNQTRVSPLSVKAASVASMWLELIHKDHSGRLAALKHRLKRFQAVIKTELSFLISKELSPNQDTHHAGWIPLFDQMDKHLSENAKQLESLLKDAEEMRLLCEQGLEDVRRRHDLPLSGLSEYTNRCVLAAAASTFSTRELILSKKPISFVMPPRRISKYIT